MTISFNAASGGTNNAISQATGVSETSPAGITPGDLLLAVAQIFTFIPGSDSGVTGISCTAGSGHVWTPVGTMVKSGVATGFEQFAQAFKRTATSGDESDTLTFHLVGTTGGTDEEYTACSVGAWHGATDVSAVAQLGSLPALNTDVGYPAITTVHDGEWVVYLGVGGINDSQDVTGPPTGYTLRDHRYDSGIVTQIADSNGSVGAAGTVIPFTVPPNGAAGTPAAWVASYTVTITDQAASDTGTGSVSMHKMGMAIVAVIPGAGSVSMHKMGLSGTGRAPLLSTGSVSMHKMGLAGADSGLSITFTGTDGNGVSSYNVVTPLNGPGTQVLRVLNPTSPAAGYPHGFIYTLPVSAGVDDTTFGDGLDHIRSLGAHNTYNLTVVEPSFAIDPWYADSDVDLNNREESFMVSLAAWVRANLATTGVEDHILIGFSKSGIGGQDLIWRNPTVWKKCISWDFPADASAYDSFGADSALSYGSDANFQAKYRLTSGFISARKAPFLTGNRIWIGGEASFSTDVSDYDALLTAQGVSHIYPTPVSRVHSWTSGWVAPALADMMVLITTGSGSVSMHKMGMSGAGNLKFSGSGSVGMHKMGLAVHGSNPITGTVVIAMHKMAFSLHAKQTSSLFVFTDV